MRVRDLKGMRYLAQLLAHPGREFHVLDLVAAETGQQMALGDAGEILDERAKTAYRRRLAEIEDDIEQARALGDDQAGGAGRRRARLPGPRARARGRPGWSRSAGRIRLRARSIRCDPRVRQGIARIGEHHPQLGEHLDDPGAPADPDVTPEPWAGTGASAQAGVRCAVEASPSG